jgi:DNA replication protein DnaC
MIEENKNCWLTQDCNHIDCDKFCIKHYKLKYLYESALIPQAKWQHVNLFCDKEGTDIEQFKFLKNIETNVLTFVSSGENLYIHSVLCGNGKTSWALRIVESYFNKIWYSSELECRALFINVPQFLLSLKDNISEKNDYISHIKENIFTADIVVWDDIATKESTVFEAENLLSMIDNRINSGKSNIFTSNLTDEEIHKALGDRLTSRICNLSYNIELKGSDKRGLNLTYEKK